MIKVFYFFLHFNSDFLIFVSNFFFVYGKGIIHTADARYQNVDDHHHNKSAEEDDAQTKFYKQHMKRTERPHASGQTPIYDFDEWNEKHYGKAFQRSQIARKRSQHKSSMSEIDENMSKTEYTMFGLAGLMLAIFVLFYQHDRSSNDKIIDRTVATTTSTGDK